jgi:intein-encoded DNA endonuclease-like protein
MPTSAKIAWVRGFVDAEGSITMNGSNQPMLSIYSKNFRKLRILGSILKENGMCVYYYKHKNRYVWQEYLTGRKNLALFMKKIGLEHPDKREKLITVLVLQG